MEIRGEKNVRLMRLMVEEQELQKNLAGANFNELLYRVCSQLCWLVFLPI